MVASVPLEQRRTMSSPGTRAHSSSAKRSSPSVGAPKLAPRAMASWTARTTAGWACPRMRGPQLPTRSM